MAKKMNPLIPLLGLGGIAALVLSNKKAGAAEPAALPQLPATPAPAAAPSNVVSVNGHTWKLVAVKGGTDVYAPAGSWGPHGELRVLRYTQTAGSKTRVLVAAAKDVPKAVMDAAMKDLKIQVPAGPTVMTPPGRAPMPQALQAEMTALGLEMGVDSSGRVRGPVTAAEVQHATELSSRLDQSGYPEAAATVRRWATDGAKMVPLPATPAVVPPGVPPELAAAIQRALQLERDPAKLEALKQSLKTLPPSAQRDMLIGALDALILQIRTAQAVSTAAVDIDQMTKPQPTASRPAGPVGPRLLKLTTPNMKGEDVRSWQNVLRSSGYTDVVPDGVFGPKTKAATQDWQTKHGVMPDGIVGPKTLAKVGTPPSGPASVPATPSPRPDPKPKSSVETAAEAMVTHLRALQQKYGVKGSKGRQDMALVKRFQAAVGGVADGLPGVNTMLAAARAGQGLLPKVMYWKRGAGKTDVDAYKAQLIQLSTAASSAGLSKLAAQLVASAASEDGSGI